MQASGAGVRPEWQAKKDLYRQVYRPFTTRWSDVLGSPKVRRVLAGMTERGRRDLPAALEKLNKVFRGLVAESLSKDMVAEVQRLRDHVLWVGDEAPGARPGAWRVRRSLTAKLQRNISLALVEALLCLESARRYAAEELGLRGRALAETLRRSRQLYTSLAVLHDRHEQERVMRLTGRSRPIEYPQVTFADVLGGSVRIPPDRFVVGGTDEEPQLRFVNPKIDHTTLSTPTMHCPAHTAAPSGDGTINDMLWEMLITMFEKAGKFEEPAA